MRFDTLLKTADNVLKYKYVVKNTAWKAGKTVTFMPKPLFQDNGSGMHTHQSLWTDDENLFWDEVGYARDQRHGALLHRRAARSTRRRCSRSPTRRRTRTAAWCRATRRRSTWCTASGTAAPASGSRCSRRPGAKRLEFRTPDPIVQPVPRVRAMLMAGLDGIKNKIEPPEPMDKDLYDLPPEEKAKVKQVPGVARGGARQPGARPPVAARGRRVHAGRDRHVDRVQADPRARRRAPAPAPVRVLCTTTCRSHGGGPSEGFASGPVAIRVSICVWFAGQRLPWRSRSPWPSVCRRRPAPSRSTGPRERARSRPMPWQGATGPSMPRARSVSRSLSRSPCANTPPRAHCAGRGPGCRAPRRAPTASG